VHFANQQRQQFSLPDMPLQVPQGNQGQQFALLQPPPSINAAIQALCQAQRTMITSMSTLLSRVLDFHRPVFPDWDGLNAYKCSWLEKIKCFKEVSFFANLTNWSKKDATSKAQSIWIRK